MAFYSPRTLELAESAAMVADLQHQLVEVRAQLAAATDSIAALLAELSAAKEKSQQASAAAENAQQGREANLHAALKGAATQQQELLVRIQHLEGQLAAAVVKEQQQHQLIDCLHTNLAAQQAAPQAALPAEKQLPVAQPKTTLAAAANNISCSRTTTIPTQPLSNHTSSCSSDAQLAGRTCSAANRTNSCSSNAQLFCSTSTTASCSSNAQLAGRTSSAATRTISCSSNARLSRSTSTTASGSSKSQLSYSVRSVSSSDSKGSSSTLPSPVVFISATWPAADIVTQQQQQGEAATVLHKGNFNQFRAGYGNVDKRKVGEGGAAVVHAINGYTLLVCERSGGTANSSSSSSVSYDCPPAAVREVAQVELQQFKEEWAAIEMVQCKTSIVMPITAAWFVAEQEVNGMVFGRAYYLTPLARMSLYDLLKQLEGKGVLGGGLPPSDVRVVLATLLHLLELGFVHADLKPENLVIDHKGRLKIIDAR